MKFGSQSDGSQWSGEPSSVVVLRTQINPAISICFCIQTFAGLGARGVPVSYRWISPPRRAMKSRKPGKTELSSGESNTVGDHLDGSSSPWQRCFGGSSAVIRPA